MTVHDLIEKLQTMPQGGVVIYRCCSDWQELHPEDIELITRKESYRLVEEREVKHPHTRLPVSGAICVRNGDFCTAYPLNNYPPGENPVYVDVVTFPGN